MTGVPVGTARPGVPGSGSPKGRSFEIAIPASISFPVGEFRPGVVGGTRGEDPVLPAVLGP